MRKTTLHRGTLLALRIVTLTKLLSLSTSRVRLNAQPMPVPVPVSDERVASGISIWKRTIMKGQEIE